MKKRTAGILCFILIRFGLLAQVPEIGFLGGFSVSQIDGDAYSGYYKPGGMAGAYAKLGVGHYAGFKTELKYISKGSSDGNQMEANNTYYRCYLHYMEANLLFYYTYRKKVECEIGPALGLLISSVEKDEYGILFNMDAFDRLELSGTIGIHYLFSERISAGIRFSYSILPVRDHVAGATWYWNRGQYNNVLSFGFSYRLFPAVKR